MEEGAFQTALGNQSEVTSRAFPNRLQRPQELTKGKRYERVCCLWKKFMGFCSTDHSFGMSSCPAASLVNVLKISVGVYSVVLDSHFFLTTLRSRILHNIVNQLYFSEKRQNRRSRIPEDKNTKMALHQIQWNIHRVSRSVCPPLCDPTDCGPPGSSVHGIFQARILEWVAISSSRGPSQSNPRLLHLLHWQAGSLPLAPPGKPHSILSII